MSREVGFKGIRESDKSIEITIGKQISKGSNRQINKLTNK